MHPIFSLLATNGHEQYGNEAVSQLEHALQCAALAESANRSAAMIAACLLHDIGHLIHNLGENPAADG
ncbi:MAG TPA: HD domain-containing protein, partial [Chroococcidiopsis sp.]